VGVDVGDYPVPACFSQAKDGITQSPIGGVKKMVGENHWEFPADVDFLLVDSGRMHALCGERGENEQGCWSIILQRWSSWSCLSGYFSMGLKRSQNGTHSRPPVNVVLSAGVNPLLKFYVLVRRSRSAVSGAADHQ
jgi:hypothetical protein